MELRINLRGYLRLVCLLWIYCSHVAVVSAVDGIQFEVGKIESDQWSLTGLDIKLQGLSPTTSINARLDSLDIATQGTVLEAIEWSCDSASITESGFACEQGRMQAEQSLLGPQDFDLGVEYRNPQSWSIHIDGMTFAGGAVSTTINMEADAWSVAINGKGLSIEAMPDSVVEELPASWTVSGKIAIELQMNGNAMRVEQFEGNLSSDNLSYSDEIGLQVAEQLAVKATVSAAQNDHGWNATGTINLTKGQLYTDPWYLEFEPQALQFSYAGAWVPGADALSLQQYHLTIKNVLDAKGDIEFAGDPLLPVSMHSSFTSADADAAYRILAQPILIGSALDSLDVKGAISGLIEFRSGDLKALELHIAELEVRDQNGLFGVDGLNVDLDWSGNNVVTRSTINWSNAQIYNMQLGGMEGRFDSSSDQLRLVSPVEISMLGGQLVLRELHIGGLYAGAVGGYISANLADLQLPELTAALGWPEMQGSLQGDIPRIDLVPGHLFLGGTLKVGVFGGEMGVSELSIADPFGVAPVFEANLSLKDLDLGQLTQTFSFGRIEGGLEGEVKNLQMIDWELSRFDASFRTPSKDARRHRISQRAIDNLTSLGNGVSGNLSNTFLRFFKDFSYSQIAIDVSLSGNTAYLGGIDLPDGGYYLVKGALLPRIDVIGRNRGVAWKDLLQRIEEVQLDSAVIN